MNTQEESARNGRNSFTANSLNIALMDSQSEINSARTRLIFKFGEYHIDCFTAKVHKYD